MAAHRRREERRARFARRLQRRRARAIFGVASLVRRDRPPAQGRAAGRTWVSQPRRSSSCAGHADRSAICSSGLACGPTVAAAGCDQSSISAGSATSPPVLMASTACIWPTIRCSSCETRARRWSPVREATSGSGAGLPRLSHFYGCGLAVAIGTDSLASVESLSMFDSSRHCGASRPMSRPRRFSTAPPAAEAEALGLGPRIRHAGARKAGRARGRRGAGRRPRCGRIPGQRRPGVLDSPRGLIPSMFARLRTYASFVRFNHSVFALPFTTRRRATAAARFVRIRLDAGDLDRRCMVSARRGHGLQSPRRRGVRRA